MRRRIRRSRSVGAAVALTLLALAMLASSTFPLGGIGGPYNAPSPTRFESLAHASGTGIVSVGVTPAAATLAAGANLTFAPDPVCSPSPCPAGVVYSWSLTRPLGQLDYSTSNANSLSTNIPTEGEVPVGLAFDSSNGDLYVTNDESTNGYVDSSVAVISASSNSLLGLIQVGGSPTGIAYDPDNGDLYVTDCGTSNMSVISGATNTVVATFPFTLTGCAIGSKMFMNFAGIAYDPVSHSIYASNYGNGTVSEINTTTDRVVQAISVGGEPWGLVYAPPEHELFVSEFNSPYLGVIDTRTDTLVTRVSLDELPSGVDYDPANGDVYVADASFWVKNPAGNGDVAVVNASTNSLVTMIRTKGYPWSVAYDSGNGCVYETDSNTTVMNVISTTTNTVVGTVPIGRSAWGYSNDFADLYEPRSGQVYVSGFNSTMVAVISGARDANTFTAGPTAGSLTLFVNATWNGTTVQSQAVPITITGGGQSSLTSVTVTPSSDSLAPGMSAGFSATAACTGGACPAGATYTWSRTNLLGGLNSTIGQSVTFTAGPNSGSETIFVNATLSGRMVQSAPVLIDIAPGALPTLTSVTVAPGGAALGPGGVADFLALPVCLGGACPQGSSFEWSLTNALGTLNSTLGSQVAFTALGTGGIDVLFVNVSLNGAKVQSFPVMVSIQSPTLSALTGVAIYPNKVTLTIGEVQRFVALPLCLPYPCPTRDLVLTWHIDNLIGILNGTTGFNVTLAAGLETGTARLILVATLGGLSVSTASLVTVSVTGTGSSPSGDWTILGVPLQWWEIGGLIAVSVAVVWLAVVGRAPGSGRRARGGTAGSGHGRWRRSKATVDGREGSGETTVPSDQTSAGHHPQPDETPTSAEAERSPDSS